MNNAIQKGKPDSEEYEFGYGATLRIVGERLDFDEISRGLGVLPTYTHREGDLYATDMWCYTATSDRATELDEHLTALWVVLKPHADFVRDLKRRFSIDIFCAYAYNGHSIYVGHECLRMFIELEIPFGIFIRDDAA